MIDFVNITVIFYYYLLPSVVVFVCTTFKIQPFHVGLQCVVSHGNYHGILHSSITW